MHEATVVTGAGGFVGAQLCATLLASGQRVIGIVRPGFNSWRFDDESLKGLDVVEMDLATAQVESALAKIRPTTVFHLAANGAYSWQQEADAIIESNLSATVHLADALLAIGSCRAFVHTGSSSEYGVKRERHGESDILKPNSLYAVTKAAATHYLAHLRRSAGFPAVTARLFSIYGPFEEPQRLIPQLVVKGMESQYPPLASPAIARDFVYVDDAVACLRLLADRIGDAHDVPEVVNVCTGKESTLNSVALTSRAAFNIATEPAFGDFPARRWDTENWSGDPGVAQELGWSPSTSLFDGLVRFRAWIEADEARRRYYFSL